jgi:hypothetical protein
MSGRTTIALGWVIATLMRPDALSGETLAVRARWMIDVETGNRIENPVVIVEGDRISSAGPAESVSIPSGARVIDRPGSYLLPGLIDAHVHLAWRRSQDQEGLAGAEEARATLLAGFTTVRNPGSTGKADMVLRDAIDQDSSSNRLRGGGADPRRCLSPFPQVPLPGDGGGRHAVPDPDQPGAVAAGQGQRYFRISRELKNASARGSSFAVGLTTMSR